MKQTHSNWFLCAITFSSMGLSLLALAGCTSKSKAGPVAAAASQSNEVTVAQESPNTDALSVQTVRPAHKDLVVKFEQAGPVEAVDQSDLYSRATGYVRTVSVDIGDEVKAGQVLLEVDVPDLQEELGYKNALVRQAEAEHEQARTAVQGADAALVAHAAALDQAEADVKKAESDRQFRGQQAKRYAELAKKEATTPELAEEKQEQWESSKSGYDSAIAKRRAIQAEKAVLTAKLDAAKADLQTKETKVDVAKADRERTRAMIEFAKIRAPFDGVITRRHFDEGAFVSSAASGRGEPIFTIARIDRLLAVMRVPEKEVTAVRVGCRASLRLDRRDIEGTVARFSPSLDEKSRTMRVEIEIDNQSRSLFPGMYASPCTLILNEIASALTVPASAVYAREGQSFVIQVNEGKAHRLVVQTGYDDGHVVQVVDGLKGEEEIVVSNKGQIAENQPLTPHRVGDSKPSAVANSVDTKRRQRP